jgi:glycosyltransferase involved in cell wall biosynthesis
VRIGLNLLYLLPGIVGGTETYAAGLLCGLAAIDRDDEFVVFVNQESITWPLPSAPNLRRVICPVWAVDRAKRYFFEQAHLPRLLKQQRIDLVHSLGYVAPLFPPCASIVTVHDLNYRAFGDQMPVVKRWALRFFVEQSVQRANHVITDSEFSRRQISSELKIAPGKLVVVPAAPFGTTVASTDLVGPLQRHGISKPYIVAFTSSSPNKNIPRLVQAFVQARRDYGLQHQLVLVGHPPPDWMPDELRSIVLTGYLDEPSKSAILAGADLLVFPSTYEGFGLPVLEAQQSGVPVACSTAGALPEVAGAAAVFFDPFSVNEIAQVIGRVARNAELRETLRHKGLQNVGRFSWDKTARSTIDVYYAAYSQYSRARRNHQ